jgi:hypothetical protein
MKKYVFLVVAIVSWSVTLGQTASKESDLAVLVYDMRSNMRYRHNSKKQLKLGPKAEIPHIFLDGKIVPLD